MPTDIGLERRDFWTALAAAHPAFGITPASGAERELRLGGHPDLRLKLSISQDKTSVYLVSATPAGRAFVAQHARALAKALGTVAGASTGEADKGRFFRKDTRLGFTQRSQWPEVIAWLGAQAARYDGALRDLGR